MVNDLLPKLRFYGRLARRIAQHGSAIPRKPTGPGIGDGRLRPPQGNRLALGWPGRYFSDSAAFRASLSSMLFASSFLRRRFRSSSVFRRWASDTSRPPYFCHPW